MYYQAVSFSHKNCDFAMREHLTFSNNEEMQIFLEHLTQFEFIHEAFVISTCNRVEVVLATRDNFASFHSVLGLMAQKSQLNFYDLKRTVKRYDDEEAIEHIFSVVSSLDSLVIGESQITGQVKDAFKFSFQNGTAGRKLNRVVSYAVKCAAKVRNVTNISQNPISIASVAVAQAHKILNDNIQGMKGIVVGAGEMGILATRHLLRVGCDVVLIGRNIEKVKRVAESLGENVKADTMENLPKYINRYRLLFSATSSLEPVITQELIENETLSRHWFDMAIPRDIADIDLPKLQLFRIDDLRSISDENHAMRQEQAIRAQEIVQKYTDEFYTWLRALSVEPVIKQMREHVSVAIEKEIQRALKKGFIPKEYEVNMRKMAQQMFNRFLHDPTQNLRKSSTEKKSANCIEEIKKIFNIDTEHIDFKQYKNDHHAKGYDT
ncbi:MAG: glutamyl-tRNA reductase [Sulfurovum sp.]|nr:glutamyl-tRNA reductase [Sulfurovum sp.]MCB4744309.1 glutamyl-tRNA reductase [Sulfurovum sp.]MCB4746296.1 glutamyl-tRNA reductase [Sulfurovum sp.]MCB4747087.1 glutamyl-tRNA reductase [Sulfurovum sp.]MCB4748726.1 glutamyl-tRNA reductase [Sulfurovum sp.]